MLLVARILIDFICLNTSIVKEALNFNPRSIPIMTTVLVFWVRYKLALRNTVNLDLF